MKTKFAPAVLFAFVMQVSIAADAQEAKGRAILRSTGAGAEVEGAVDFQETAEGLRVQADFSKAPPGLHGFHIHEFGSCEDQGKAAGDHYNPAGAPHGKVIEAGMEQAHAGDFGNIEIGADGSGKLDFTVPGLGLTGGPHPVAGRAMVLHAEADKFTQPAGDAGGRIGCGAIVLVK